MQRLTLASAITIYATFLVAGCASETTQTSNGIFGPPAAAGDVAPATGLQSFQPMGSWGPNNNTLQPGTPGNWTGGFKGN